MKPNLDYYSKLLAVFTDAETANISLQDISQAGIIVAEEAGLNEEFLFHTQLAIDNQLIARKEGAAQSMRDLGVNETIDGYVTVVD